MSRERGRTESLLANMEDNEPDAWKRREDPTISWTEIVARAPGKVVISGDYWGVADKPSIIGSINLWTMVRVRPSHNERVKLDLKIFNRVYEWPLTLFIEHLSQIPDLYENIGNLNYVQLERNFARNDYRLEPSRREKRSSSSGGGSASEPPLTKRIVPMVNGGEADEGRQIDEAIVKFVLIYLQTEREYGGPDGLGLIVEVDSELPTCAGLGSSSAYSVALSVCLAKAFRDFSHPFSTRRLANRVDSYLYQNARSNNDVIYEGGIRLAYSVNGPSQKLLDAEPAEVKHWFIVDCGLNNDHKQVLVTRGYHDDNEVPFSVKRQCWQLGNHTLHLWDLLRLPHSDDTIHRMVELFKKERVIMETFGLRNEHMAKVLELKWDEPMRQLGTSRYALVIPDQDAESTRIELENSGLKYYEIEVGGAALRVEMRRPPTPSKKPTPGSSQQTPSPGSSSSGLSLLSKRSSSSGKKSRPSKKRSL